MSISRRHSAVTVAMLAALALWFSRLAPTPRTTTGQPGDAIPAVAASPASSSPAPAAKVAAGGSSVPGSASPAAIAAATARRDHMFALMSADPARALAESVSIADYAALSDELRPLYEKPFHAVADLDVLPVCGDPSHPDHSGHAMDNVLVLRLADGRYETTTTIPTMARFSRQGAPLHGITLGGRAVVADGPVAVLSAADAAFVAELPLGQRDATRDFATGAPIDGEPVVGVAGDRRLLFASVASADEFNRRLATLDSRPGPRGGSGALLALPYPADASSGFDWAAAEAYATAEASAWTETPKSVLFIRADFSDVPGSVTQATLGNLLNTSVASAITAMSYGKTTVSAVVSPEIVRLPAASSTYTTNSDLLHDHARAAYEAIHGAGSTSGYDIVGVQFPSIGANSGGVVYAGLATVGGSRHWLQGNPSEGVVVHEFGHNYGLGHSNFWQTSDGSVVGTGTNVEYGDRFDVMGGGASPEAHFHPQGKALLNWLTTSQWTDANVAGSGTYRIYRFDHASTTGTTRGLRTIKDPSGTAASVGYYWVGYRPGIAGNPYLPNGAYLIWERPDFNRSWLLDTTPGTAAGRDDAALRVGRTYSDTTAGVHFTTLGVGGSGADAWMDLRVELGTSPGNTAPSATFSPTLTVAARTPQLFTVTASDANGDTLAYGWDFGDASTPSSSPSVTQSWTVGGTYAVSVAISDMKGGVTTRAATITVTDPALEWTDSTVAASRTLTRTAYLRGRHLVGGNGYLYASADRSVWSESYLGTNYRCTGFAADSAAFVAVGYDYDFTLSRWVGVVHRSLDGRVWQKITLPATVSELRAVAASGAGTLVAVGDDSTMLRSTDSGATWTVQTAPATADLDSLDFGGGVFMAVGDTCVFTSADGASWTDRSSAVLLASWQSFRVVRYAGGAWYAGGWYSGVHRSTDAGVSWSECSIVGSGDYTIDGIAAGSGVLLASVTRHENSTTYNEFLISADGLTWNEGPGSAPFASTASLSYADGAFHAASSTTGMLARSGAIASTNQTPVASIRSVATADARQTVAFDGSATDADGDTLTYLWDFGDGTAYGEGTQVSHIFPVGGTYTVKLHVADGRGGIATATKSLTVAEPLASWTALTSGTTSTLYDIASSGSRLVAVGAGSGTYRYSTNDGSSWSGATLGTNISLYGLAYGNGLFVAVGENYDFAAPAGWKGTIYTSPDGAVWTRRLFTGPALRDVAYAAGRYIVVGDTGTLYTSTDAVTWSLASSGTTNNLHGVAYGNGVFVIAGANGSSTGGTVLTSPDGDSWTNASSGLGTSQGLFELAYAGDRFLASGYYAGLRHSTNGGATFASTTATAKRADGFALLNGVYLAVVRDLANSDAAQNFLSLDGATWTVLAPPSATQRYAIVVHAGVFITVGSGGEIWRSAALPATTSGFANWRASRFPGLPAGSAATDDPDGDGIKNLAEYGLGLNPSVASTSAALAAEILAGELTLTVPRTVGVSDLHIVFETSTDLATWTENGVVIVDSGDELTGAVPASPGRRFLRARFTLAP